MNYWALKKYIFLNVSEVQKKKKILHQSLKHIFCCMEISSEIDQFTPHTFKNKYL